MAKKRSRSKKKSNTLLWLGAAAAGLFMMGNHRPAPTSDLVTPIYSYDPATPGALFAMVFGDQVADYFPTREKASQAIVDAGYAEDPGVSIIQIR